MSPTVTFCFYFSWGNFKNKPLELSLWKPMTSGSITFEGVGACSLSPAGSYTGTEDYPSLPHCIPWPPSVNINPATLLPLCGYIETRPSIKNNPDVEAQMLRELPANLCEWLCPLIQKVIICIFSVQCTSYVHQWGPNTVLTIMLWAG